MTLDMSESGRRRIELVVALVGGMASFTFYHDLIISATDLPCLLVFAAVVAPAVGLLDAMTAPSRLTEVRSRRLFKVIVIITTVIKICATVLVIAFASSAVCMIVYSLLHVMRDEPPLAALLLILIPWLPVAILARRWARRLSIWMGLLLVLLLTALYFAVLGTSVEALYPRYVEELKARHGNGRSLERAWGMAVEYFRDFHFTYGRPCPKPRQLSVLLCGEKYAWVFRELEALARTGSCEDFALGLTTLLRDALGCEVRVVAFKGLDHAMPEVKVNGTWYVLDVSYTTLEGPVRAEEYMGYLWAHCGDVASKVRGVVDRETGLDVSHEHGLRDA
jgi:hypothetical protein